MDRIAVVLLVAEAASLGVALRHRLTKPFWYDEVWRAYRVTMPGGWWHHLAASDGPYAAGFAAVEWLSTGVFGNHEWALRLPVWLALPALGLATYRLVRHLAGPTASWAAAAALEANISIVDFGTQLKPFTVEALAAVLLVLLAIGGGSGSPLSRLSRAAAMAVCCLVATPAVFVLVPLVAYDILRAVRGRRGLPLTLATSAVALVPAGLHLLLFVVPQAGLSKDPFWTRDYASSSGYASVLVHGLSSVLLGLVSGVGRPDSTLTARLFTANGPVLAAVLTVVMIAGLARGTWRAAGSTPGRCLLVALGGAAALVYAASALGRWPFALERVNLFLVPLLFAVFGAGLAHSSRGEQSSRARAAGLVLVTLLTAGTAAVLADTGRRDLRFAKTGDGSTGELLEATGSAVADARRWAGPLALVVVHPQQAQPAWDWYMHRHAAAGPGVEVPADREAMDTAATGFDGPGRPRSSDGDLVGLLRRHPEARQLLLFVLPRPHQPSVAARLGSLRAMGWCRTRERSYPHTGALVDLRRCR